MSDSDLPYISFMSFHNYEDGVVFSTILNKNMILHILKGDDANPPTIWLYKGSDINAAKKLIRRELMEYIKLVP